MAKEISAGLLMYRWRNGEIEVLIAHPGGPYYEDTYDENVWTIPKGLVEKNENLLTAAKREFCEETGLPEPSADPFSLGQIKQKNGKLVNVWAFEGNVDEGWEPSSNLFEMEWPSGSGKIGRFPEIDRAEFFSFGEAGKKLNPAQTEFLDRLVLLIGKDMASRMR